MIFTVEPIVDNEDIEEFEIDEYLRLSNRYNVINDLNQLQNKLLIFLPNLYNLYERERLIITSFFIQRSIYFDFFGKEIDIAFENLNSL